MIFFVPDLCHIEVKTPKNKHKQKKPNKNWDCMGIKGLRRDVSLRVTETVYIDSPRLQLNWEFLKFPRKFD